MHHQDPQSSKDPHQPSEQPFSPSEPTPALLSEPSPSKPTPSQPTKAIETDASSQTESQKIKQESFEGKTGEHFRHSRDSRKVEDLYYYYAQSNKEQTLTYLALGLGLVFLLFFNNLLGGLMIGMVAGYYFAAEIIYYLRNIGQIIGGHDQLRYAVLTSLLLGLFIAAPGIFIGAAIVAAFKQVLIAPRDHEDSSKT